MFKYLSYHNSIIIIILLSLLFISCEDTTSPPPPKPESPREYKWTIDTLQIDSFQNLMRDSYASGLDNIYLVGHNSGSSDYPGNGEMWHYDGKKWAVVDIKGQMYAKGTTNAISGSSESNIWIAGYKGHSAYDYVTPFIAEYDGVSWKRHEAEEQTNLGLFDIYAVSENEIWACGDKGLVYNYDGNGWNVDTIKIIPLNQGDELWLQQIIKFNSDIYVWGNVYTPGRGWQNVYSISKRNEKWEIVDQYFDPDLNFKFGNNLYVSPNNELFSCGSGGIYKFDNGKWENIYFSNSAITDISINEKNEIMAVGIFGKVYHFNGTSWQQFEDFEFEHTLYSQVLMFESEVFIVGRDLTNFPQKSFVIHGK